METKSEREIDMKNDADTLMRIRKNLQNICQSQLLICNERIVSSEKVVKRLVEMLRQQGLNDEQKANLQVKIDEEKAFLNKLYDLREKIIKEMEDINK